MNKELNNQEEGNELELCEKERAEYLEGWQRAKADLANYKKEQEDRRQELARMLVANALLQFLPVIDNLERAEKGIPEAERSSSVNQGFLQIILQCREIFKRYGVESMESVGTPFDPLLHEAVGEAEGEQGIVVEDMERGYTLGGKVIRPAKVKIGNGIHA